MRVGLVNDLPIALEALRRAVARYPGASVAWSAMDGAEAVRLCKSDRPDMVLMDLVMPNMDGVEATRRIMRESPCPILVVTATVTGHAARVFEALGAGALDAIDTPTLAEPDGLDRLCRRMRHIARITSDEVPFHPPSTPTPMAYGHRAVPLVLVGASTGGPQALCALLRAVPKPPPCAMLVVQHLDAAFLPGLVAWLGEETGHDVQVAHDGETLAPGMIRVAGGVRHLLVDAEGRLAHVDAATNELHHPSVDQLFHSATRNVATPGVAVLLTGMGRDGAHGMRALRDAGWFTIAQDQATSVVWGMPGAAVRLQAAAEVLPLAQIAPAMLANLRRSTPRGH